MIAQKLQHAIARVKAWYAGETEISGTPGPEFTRIHTKRHWAAEVAYKLVAFYQRHWQWVWATAIAVASILLSRN